MINYEIVQSVIALCHNIHIGYRTALVHDGMNNNIDIVLLNIIIMSFQLSGKIKKSVNTIVYKRRH